MRRGLIALLLAFGWLFATPAQATPLVNGDTIQFSYTWGTVTRTFTDQVVTVTVVNDITNKIGGNGEVIDTYRIKLGNQAIEVTEKHGAKDYTFTITESQTLILEGIDRGFWAGYYGPIMTIATTPIVLPLEPVTQSPQTESQTTSDVTSSPTQSDNPTQSQPIIWDYVVNEGGVLNAEAPTGKIFANIVARYVAHDSSCGLDVSQVIGAVLIGTSSGIIPANNDTFGDPCPGWYKKLIVSVEYSSAIMIPPSESPTLSPTASPEPTPEPQPIQTPEPTYAPSPEPIPPQTTPEPTPLETPTVSYPTQSPEPEPTQSPTSPTEPTTQSPQTVSPTPQAPITPEAPQIPIVEPTPIQSSEGQNEETLTTTAEVIEIPEETFAESLSATIQASVTQAIGNVSKAVGQLVETFTTAGLDMTPEQREEAQDVVVSTVLASQVAAGIRRIK
jgi:hypothetical protein